MNFSIFLMTSCWENSPTELNLTRELYNPFTFISNQASKDHLSHHFGSLPSSTGNQIEHFTPTLHTDLTSISILLPLYFWLDIHPQPEHLAKILNLLSNCIPRFPIASHFSFSKVFNLSSYQILSLNQRLFKTIMTLFGMCTYSATE